MKKQHLILLLIVLALPLAIASVSTVTTVYFNVGQVLGFTLSLPGSSTAATQGGAATASIEFNSTTGTDTNLNAKVSGGVTQTDGTPIFSYDNTGTVDLNLSIAFGAALPSCIRVKGNSTYDSANSSNLITTTNLSVVSDFGPSDPAVNWYIKANFTGCTSPDTTTRTLRSSGEQS